MELKSVLLGIAWWNVLVCSPGNIFGYVVLNLPIEVFLVTGAPLLSIATGIVGPLMDFVGPRAVGTCGCIVSCAGYLLIASTEPGVATLHAHLGLAMLTFGGMGPYLGSFSVAQLFEHPERPIAKNAGLMTLSGLNFQLLQNGGMTRETICMTFASLQAVGAVLACIGLPASQHHQTNDGDFLLARIAKALCYKRARSLQAGSLKVPLAALRGCESSPTAKSPSNLPSPRAGPTAVVVPTIKEIKSRQFPALAGASWTMQVFSAEYIGIVTWYALNLILMDYFFATVGPHINDAVFCKQVMYIGTVLPAFASLFVGQLMVVLGWGVATFITTCASILMLLLAAMQDLSLGYVALIVFAVQRSLLFSCFLAYLAATFGFVNYGRLCGLASLITGVCGFVNAPILQHAGLVHSGTAVCPLGGVVCESWIACAACNAFLAVLFSPIIMYSVWLCRQTTSHSEITSSQHTSE